MLKDGMTLDATNQSFADKYLIQDENGGITLNNKVFQDANQHADIFVLVSDSVRDGKQAYYGYKDRRTVEDCFLDLKVKMCCDRFRTSSEDSLVGKCFVEFVALSLYMRMEHDLRKLLGNCEIFLPFFNFLKNITFWCQSTQENVYGTNKQCCSH